MERNLRQIRWLLAQESGYRVVLMAFNYFLYFWRMKLMRGRRRGRGAGSIRRAIDKFNFLNQERLAYAAQAHRVRRTRRALKPWRRQRFHQRSFYPICASFLSADFDGALAAKVVAMELQILRIYHKRFMRYMRSFLGFCWQHWNRNGLLEGLRLEVRGRMTDHRRQVRRAQTKTWRWGNLKKSDLRVEANHHRQLAYNRYGVISVSFTYQHRAVAAERWDDRLALTPIRGFALRSLVEAVGEERDQPLPSQLGLLRNPAYLAEPYALLDRSSALERLQAQRTNPAAAAELASLSRLDLLNRCGYHQYRLEQYRSHLRRGPYRRLLLRARPVLHTPQQGYSPRYRMPLHRAGLATLPQRLQRLQLQGLRRQQGLPWQGAELSPSARSLEEARATSGQPGGVHPKVAPAVLNHQPLPWGVSYPMGKRQPVIGHGGRRNQVTTPWLRLRRSNRLRDWENSDQLRPKKST
jgi:hypothetical protein